MWIIHIKHSECMTTETYISKVSKLLRNKNVKSNNIKYYCTKYPEWNNRYSIEPMFDGEIEPYQFHQPIEKLGYNDKFLTIAKNLSNSIITKTSRKIDQIVLEYIKCRKKCILITMRYKKIDPNLLKYLSSIGHIYYIKHIKLSFNACRSLIYQLYADTNKYNSVEEIDELLKDIYKFDKNGGYISVIAFDNINNKPFTLIDRKINKYILTPNAFYITTMFSRMVEHAQIYFCDNSIKFLEKQLLSQHISVGMRKSRIMLATFRNWLSNTISLEKRRNFMIFSGCTLYVYGIRNIHDIDVYIDSPAYDDNIVTHILNDDTKFCFIDSIMPNTNTWKQYWNGWSNKWANMLNAKSFDELLYNQKYHFYYLGMKFMVLQGDIQRRLIRQRPRAIVDLIKINELLNYKVTIPSIPNLHMKYIHLDKNEKVEKLEKNQKYNEKNREIECIERVDKEQFLMTMQWYFRSMYYQNCEIDEIKKMVDMRTIRVKLKKADSETSNKVVRIRIKKN